MLLSRWEITPSLSLTLMRCTFHRYSFFLFPFILKTAVRRLKWIFDDGKYTSGHLLLLLYGSALQYFEDGQVNRVLVKKPEGLKRLRCWKKKTRVENSPGDYFAEMNLQRMTAGVEWKKRREKSSSLSLYIYIYIVDLNPCVFTATVIHPRRFVQNEILIW